LPAFVTAGEVPAPNGVQADAGSAFVPYAAGPTPTPAAVGILRAMAQCWKRALLVGLVLGGIGAVTLWFVRPAGYTAIAVLQISASEPRLLTDRDRGTASGSLEAAMYQRAQVALIKSRQVIKEAMKMDVRMVQESDARPAQGSNKVANLSLLREHTDPATWLEDNLKATIMEGTDLLRLSLNGQQAEDVAIVVNAIVKAYLRDIVDNDQIHKRERLDELVRAFQSSEENNRTKKQELRNMAKVANTTDSQVLSQKQRLLLDQYAGLIREKTGLESKLRVTQLKVATLQSNLKAETEFPVASHLVEEQVDADGMVQQQQHEVFQIANKIAAYQQRSVHQGIPETLQRAHRESQERLEKLREEVREVATERVRRKARGQAETTLKQEREQIELLTQQRDQVSKEADDLKTEAEKIGINSLEVEVLKAEIEQAERVLKALGEEKERLQVELQSKKRRVNVVHAAGIPEVRDVKIQILGAGLGGACGFLFGLFGVSFREFRQGKITTRHQVVRDIGLRVVGTLPQMTSPRLSNRPPTNGQSSRQQSLQQNLLVDSIDGIRTMLLCDQSPGTKRALMIASANCREGKTVLATHLATSIARTGRRTLLLDCDLRRPATHQILDVPVAPGLSEVLRGETAVADAVRPTWIPGLMVLTAGQSNRQAIGALARDEMRQCFEQLRREYDFIVVDSCPILLVPDSLLISKYVDAVVLSVRPSVSHAASVLAACERLQSLGVQILGTVINGDLQFADYYSEYESLPSS
jgi:capsular exopolysaccharide synthesis family protein